jgi:hypothetical protein
MVAAVLEGLKLNSRKVRDLRLLAWHGMSDDRPVHVEQALFWADLSNQDSGKRWSLVQIGRNPDRGDVFASWGLYIVMDTPWQPVKSFDHPPNNIDVYSFLQFWSFAPDKPWRLLTCGVREQTWKYVTGELPTKLYPAGCLTRALS